MEGTRRVDARLASRVHCGISLQRIAGTEESRHLVNCRAPAIVIKRVFSYPCCARRSRRTVFLKMFKRLATSQGTWLRMYQRRIMPSSATSITPLPHSNR